MILTCVDGWCCFLDAGGFLDVAVARTATVVVEKGLVLLEKVRWLFRVAGFVRIQVELDWLSLEAKSLRVCY